MSVSWLAWRISASRKLPKETTEENVEFIRFGQTQRSRSSSLIVLMRNTTKEIERGEGGREERGRGWHKRHREGKAQRGKLLFLSIEADDD